MSVLLSCNRVITIIWLHYLELTEVLGENIRWELLHKGAMCYFEKIMEVAPLKTTTVPSLGSRLTNHPIKTNNT